MDREYELKINMAYGQINEIMVQEMCVITNLAAIWKNVHRT